MISAIRQFHDGMRACVRLDDRVCSRWFAVEQGICQGCVHAPLLFNIFFAVVINVGESFNDWRGRGSDDSVPWEVTKQLLSAGDRTT